MIEDMARVGTSAASAAMAASPPLSKRPITKVEIDWKTKPGTTPPEIADILKLLENAKDPAQVRDLLLRLYGFYETADEATRSRIRQWVEYWRALYLDGWESRYRKADEAVIKNPGLRFDVGKQIHELHQELKALRQRFEPISPSLNERENQCLFISELRARELGSPP